MALHRKKRISPLAFLTLLPKAFALLEAKRTPPREVISLLKLTTKASGDMIELLKQVFCVCAAVQLKNGRRSEALKLMRRAQRGGFSTSRRWKATYEKCRELVPEVREILYAAVIAEYSEVREFNTGVTGPDNTDMWPTVAMKSVFDAVRLSVLSHSEYAKLRMAKQDLDLVGQHIFELPAAPAAYGISSSDMEDGDGPFIRYVCVLDPVTREGVLSSHYSAKRAAKQRLVMGGHPQDHIQKAMAQDREVHSNVAWDPQIWPGEGYYSFFDSFRLADDDG